LDVISRNTFAQTTADADVDHAPPARPSSAAQTSAMACPDLGHGLLKGIQVSPAQPADGVVDAAQLDEVRIPRDPGRIFNPEISGLSFPRSPDFGTEKHA